MSLTTKSTGRSGHTHHGQYTAVPAPGLHAAAHHDRRGEQRAERTCAGEDLVLVVRLAVLVLGRLHVQQGRRGHLVGLEAALRDRLACPPVGRVRADLATPLAAHVRAERGGSGSAVCLLTLCCMECVKPLGSFASARAAQRHMRRGACTDHEGCRIASAGQMRPSKTDLQRAKSSTCRACACACDEPGTWANSSAVHPGGCAAGRHQAVCFSRRRARTLEHLLAQQEGHVAQELVRAAVLLDGRLVRLLHVHRQVVHGVAVVLIPARARARSLAASVPALPAAQPALSRALRRRPGSAGRCCCTRAPGGYAPRWLTHSQPAQGQSEQASVLCTHCAWPSQ